MPESTPQDRPRVRVGAVLLLDGRFVTVRHRKAGRAYHLFPGGGVGSSETLSEALEREVLEETGLNVEAVRPLFLNDSIAPDGSRHVIQITFHAIHRGGRLIDAPEDPRVEAVDLFEPGELTRLDLRPPIAHEVLDAMEHDFGVRTRYLGALWTD